MAGNSLTHVSPLSISVLELRGLSALASVARQAIRTRPLRDARVGIALAFVRHLQVRAGKIARRFSPRRSWRAGLRRGS